MRLTDLLGSPVVAALASAPGLAQTAHVIETPIVAAARATAQRDQRTIPAGPIGAGQSTLAFASSGQIMSRSDTSVLPAGNGAVWSLSLSSVVVGFVSFGSGSAEVPSGEILLAFGNTRAGTVVVSVSGATTGNAAVQADVDVGADGTIEVSAGAGTLRRELRACSSGTLLVRVAARGSAFADGPSQTSGSANLTVAVTVVPGVRAAAFTAYGPSCGPSLAAVDLPAGNDHHITFNAAGGFPGGGVAFLFGLQRTMVQVGSCLLLTPPLAAFIVPADGAGGASLSLVVPGPLPRILIDAQAAAFDAGLNVLTTGGLEFELSDC